MITSAPPLSPSFATVLIASGASGGHLFPALATAEELRKSGINCVFVLGGIKFADLVEKAHFPLEKLPASAYNGRGILGRVLAIYRMVKAVYKAMQLMLKYKPSVVMASGGYASVATMLAAKAMGIPTLIQEQNVLPGRANRLLARLVDVVVTTFPESEKYLKTGCHTQIKVLGTPLREEMEKAAKASHKAKEKSYKTLNLLITGGSQGSRIWNDVVPETLKMMTPEERKNITITHQAIPADVEKLKKIYKGLNLKETTVQPFFADMPQRYAAASLMLARSGTSTMLEAALMGLPTFYVPHRLADNHQKLNAEVAEKLGAALVMEEPMFTPANLLVQLRGLWQNPARLEAMRQAAWGMVQPGAAKRVATQVKAMIQSDVMEGAK